MTTPYDPPPPPDPYGGSYGAQGNSGQEPPSIPYPDQYVPPYPYANPYTAYYDPYAQRTPGTNGLAIASLICAFLVPPLGIILGHISLSQIRRSGEEGRGVAIAGLAIGYALTALGLVVVVLMIALMAVWSSGYNDYNHYGRSTDSFTASPAPDIDELPSFAPPATLGADCRYPAADKPASKPAQPPRSGRVPTEPAEVTATIDTDRGAIELTLDNAKAPCTVNSFVSLAQQGYFDATSCHRLTANNSLSVLQCGDPTGSGTGGPGYTFADEYPTNQYAEGDAKLGVPVRYPRGTLAMANSGAGTNGSQFFIVYADSKLPPTYTVFGSVDETGLATVDRIAEAGVTGGNLDGKPALPVQIESIRLD